MKHLHWYTTAALVIILGAVVGLAHKSAAAVHGDQPAKSGYGHTAVLNSASTKVFTGLLGRNAFAIYNAGPNTIYCGFDSAVTTSTGFPVPTVSQLGIDVTYVGSSDKDFYCIAATADQSGASDTRWIQVK